ncbi:hypothetical protein ACOPJQ_05260 [Luteimonas dalianensis]|uniref:hypothetical protein n=1 Tax=Luteimonas dalianensis TaxID=1148196 RepID=UPI003BF31B98
MKKILILTTMALQGCMAANPVDPPLQSHMEAETAEADVTHGPDTESCAQLLATVALPDDHEKLSAFNLFNENSLSADTPDPAEINVPANNRSPASIACLPPDYFNFLKIIEGELVAGTNEDVSLISAWRIPDDRYFMAYLYKAYVVEDGEGSSIIISGVIADPKGEPLAFAEEISSWYQYEGSVRIRDFSYSKGRFVQTEEVFDPIEVDEIGRPIQYLSNGKESVKEGRLTADSFPTHRQTN